MCEMTDWKQKRCFDYDLKLTLRESLMKIESKRQCFSYKLKVHIVLV